MVRAERHMPQAMHSRSASVLVRKTSAMSRSTISMVGFTVELLGGSQLAPEGPLEQRVEQVVEFLRNNRSSQPERVTATLPLVPTPCARIPVATVGGVVAEGMTPEEIHRADPDRVAGDIREALARAAETVQVRELPRGKVHVSGDNAVSAE